MNTHKTFGIASLAGYAGSILAANWFIGHVGECIPNGPCVIPVGLGQYAPSGVLWVGAALFLRDVVQDTLGRKWAVAGIVLGALLSWWVENPALAFASAAAFLLSELADFALYQPLRARGRHAAAVLVSGIGGGLVDSAVFLSLAGIPLAFLAGQWLGKTEITALCALLVMVAHGVRREVRWAA